jgi:hypothetical protein
VKLDAQAVNEDALRSLFERFKRAGWISDFSLNDLVFDLKYTPLGLQRIDAFKNGAKDFKDSGFEFTSLAAGELRDCFAELLPPKLSINEYMAFFGFLNWLIKSSHPS